MKKHQILLEKNVPCQLSDGTILYADIYRPNDDHQYPVLLTRLPYNKNHPFYSHRYLDTNRLVENGYVVIIQDVRGRFASEGEFFPFKYEGKDGYDAVEWAAKLPYSNGKVGMYGLSYYGFTQLLAAAENPPHLKAIFPAQTFNDLREGSFYQNGAYGLGMNITWALESIAPDEIQQKFTDPEVYQQKMHQLAKIIDNIEEVYHYFPLREWPELKEIGVADYFYEMMEYGLNDKIWDDLSLGLEKLKKITVPAYHLGGWYDNLLGPTIANYVHANEFVNQPQKLMIGPWAHGDFSSQIGQRKFGQYATQEWIDGKEDLTSLHLRWFDYWLKEKETNIMDEKSVKIFVMGKNTWREEDTWPLPHTEYVPYYFHSDGNANTRFGSGRLSIEMPGKEQADHFVFDPSTPVPSTGGGTLFDQLNSVGPQDQRIVEEREDVLVFTSEVLTEAMEVTGPIKVILYAKTDACSTDFTAKLVDVYPDGTAFNLTDGIVRSTFRSGLKKEDESIQDHIISYEIDLWATSNVFLPGHQIRVEISSSNFPRFDVNFNNRTTMIDGKNYMKANQTVYHTIKNPSHILLPVIPSNQN
ncbi:CocE/NonD family hydrolase [Metabacillus sediminilitoris]|uniref:CocE/NonD family hydrolase n=1 Tax=Metabacillus sediminilitoris TaxID=2567941 RepID=A0A4S4BW16_9BACI|nr:CocE/NonD family hydrolase [Metabacillus sediminilitoris]QGQ44998.1 CocE/NonD family hydrolase [Metabacillus sediminilitoris]THF78631.1 CocE/NonD family hydrolase [Metabacillus sediminilitoris]